MLAEVVRFRMADCNNYSARPPQERVRETTFLSTHLEQGIRIARSTPAMPSQIRGMLVTRWLQSWWNRSPRSSTLTARPQLHLETMEAREVPAALAGNAIALPLYDASTDTAVEVYNPATGAAFYRSFQGFRGEIVAAAGDVTGDGVADAIVGVQNANGLVAVFDGTNGGLLGAGVVFPGLTGRLNLGTADLNGDGFADVLVTADTPGAPVRAFDVHNGLTAGFNAFPGVSGQVSVTGADLNGDGRDEIIVGIGGTGLGGRVAAFNVDGSLFNYGGPVFPGFNGAISLAAGDFNGDGRDDVVVGTGPGLPGGKVKVISGVGGVLADFVPFAPSVTSGVNVFVADGNGDGKLDVFVSLQGGSFPFLTGFEGTTGHFLAGAGFGFGTYTGLLSGNAPSSTDGNMSVSSDPVGVYDSVGDSGSTSGQYR